MDILEIIMHSSNHRKRWDARHRSRDHGEPSSALQELLPDLPAPPGRALDVACGAGANARLLAHAGYTVDAMDWSFEALSQLRHPRIRAIVCDVTRFPLPESRYDVVVCARFLERSLFPKLARSLAPSGALFVETFTVAHLEDYPGFPQAYCLEPGELLSAFEPTLKVEHYREAKIASLLARRRVRNLP